MGEGTRKCAYIGCTKEFVPSDPRQIYCSVACREKAKNLHRPRVYKEPKGDVRKCTREDCKIYSKTLANHCDGLVELPEDLERCSFYKKK